MPSRILVVGNGSVSVSCRAINAIITMSSPHPSPCVHPSTALTGNHDDTAVGTAVAVGTATAADRIHTHQQQPGAAARVHHVADSCLHCHRLMGLMDGADGADDAAVHTGQLYGPQ